MLTARDLTVGDLVLWHPAADTDPRPFSATVLELHEQAVRIEYDDEQHPETPGCGFEATVGYGELALPGALG